MEVDKGCLVLVVSGLGFVGCLRGLLWYLWWRHCFLGYRSSHWSYPRVGIVWNLRVYALIVNAQPFGFLMGRHFSGGGRKAFHYFSETLVQCVHGCYDFGELGIKIGFKFGV